LVIFPNIFCENTCHAVFIVCLLDFGGHVMGCSHAKTWAIPYRPLR
jgi:hypothetical protein